jgi:hypothetical protein
VTDEHLKRIADALDELVRIEREKRDARRKPRQPREQRVPTKDAHAKATKILRRLAVR